MSQQEPRNRCSILSAVVLLLVLPAWCCWSFALGWDAAGIPSLACAALALALAGCLRRESGGAALALLSLIPLLPALLG